MRAKVIIVAAFVLAAFAIVMLVKGGDKSDKKKETDKPGTTTVVKPTGQATEIQVVYSTEKKDWIETVTAEFVKAHPEIKVSLVGKGSIDAAQAILDGQLKPVVWSPADTMVMNLLASDWQTKNHANIVATAGEDMPQPLVLTP